MKLFYYDTETTGVLHWKNGIHQISAIIEIDGVVKQELDLKVAPNPKAIIDPKALEVGGVTIEQIRAYPDMFTVYAQIIKTLGLYVDKYDKTDKFFLVGYNNASFDDNFFQAFFKQNNDEYFRSWFWWPAIDVAILAGNYLSGVRTIMPRFTLGDVARALGVVVEGDKLHDAMYDVRVTHEIYKLLNNKDEILQKLAAAAERVSEAGS